MTLRREPAASREARARVALPVPPVAVLALVAWLAWTVARSLAP